MIPEETRQLLALIYSLSTWEGNQSAEAMNLKVQAFHLVLQHVPYLWAQQYVVECAQNGRRVSEASQIASAWSEHRKKTLEEADEQIIIPDQLPLPAQRNWLLMVRTGIGAGMPLSSALEQANNRFGIKAIEGTKPVSAEESKARLRELIARFNKEMHASGREN